VNKKLSWQDEAACALATTLYTGLSPVAPGTVGAAVAALVLWFVKIDQGLALLGLAVVSALTGVWAAKKAEERWGKDPGRVNWDEVAGMMISLLFLPHTATVFILAFVAFRFFDILKPVPVSTAEKLPHGWGIVADDVMAGLYANITVQLIVRFWLSKG
jgi:phosphatidylglycerophosphatase A